MSHFPPGPDTAAAEPSRYRRAHSPLLDDDHDQHTPRTPTMDMSMQDAMLDQSPDQRGAAANRAASRRPTNGSGNEQQQSAFFSGPARVDSGGEDSARAPVSRRRVPRHSRRQSESLDAALAAEAGKPLPHQHQHQHQQNGGMPAAYHEAAARQVQIPPSQRQQQASPPRGGPKQQQQQQQQRAPSPSDISRIGSPSIATSVLHPLESKMREYADLMDDAQRQLSQLDDELIALQERRRQAEERFVDAKAKHDTYERQHADVERALRGDFQQQHGMAPPPFQQQQQFHQQQQFGSRPSLSRPRPPSADSYGERPMSGQSHGTKGKGGRFRLSLFK
jgi:hypothetical protein